MHPILEIPLFFAILCGLAYATNRFEEGRRGKKFAKELRSESGFQGYRYNHGLFYEKPNRESPLLAIEPPPPSRSAEPFDTHYAFGDPDALPDAEQLESEASDWESNRTEKLMELYATARRNQRGLPPKNQISEAKELPLVMCYLKINTNWYWTCRLYDESLDQSHKNPLIVPDSFDHLINTRPRAEDFIRWLTQPPQMVDPEDPPPILDLFDMAMSHLSKIQNDGDSLSITLPEQQYDL